MNNAPLISHEYETAYIGTLATAIGFINQQDPIVGSMPVRATRHSGPLAHVEGRLYEDPIRKREFSFSLDRIAVISSSGSTFERFVRDQASDLLKDQIGDWEQTMIAITQRTGRAPIGGMRLTWESCLYALEHMDLSFSDEGVPNQIELIASGEALKTLEKEVPPPDFEVRFNNMINRKKEEWFAKKRTRRLSLRT